MTEIEINQITDLCAAIGRGFADFKINTENHTNKTAARRARKNTLELGRLLKKYRETSIK